MVMKQFLKIALITHLVALWALFLIHGIWFLAGIEFELSIYLMVECVVIFVLGALFILELSLNWLNDEKN